MENKIDKSFKGWIKLMWSEKYLPLFIIFLFGSIAIPLYYGLDYLAIDILFGIVMVVIAYKGFYQRWIDHINNRTR